jgi:hypothetical protein
VPAAPAPSRALAGSTPVPPATDSRGPRPRGGGSARRNAGRAARGGARCRRARRAARGCSRGRSRGAVRAHRVQ